MARRAAEARKKSAGYVGKSVGFAAHSPLKPGASIAERRGNGAQPKGSVQRCPLCVSGSTRTPSTESEA